MISCPNEWERLLSTTFAPGQVRIARGESGGQIDRQSRINQLLVAHLSVRPQAIEHTVSHLQTLSDEARGTVIAHVVVGGTGFIQQSGLTMPFQAGDISFRNFAEPSNVVFETPTNFFAIRLPSTGFYLHKNNHSPQKGLLPKIVKEATHCSDIAQRLLGGLVYNKCEQIENLYISLALPWIMAGAYHSDTPAPRAPSLNTVRWQQILSYFDHHQFDSDSMSPSACAQGIGISERYLHKLFALHGERFSKFVLERRLNAARAMLENTAYRWHSIASIAYQCGFADAAYFSRAFRQRFNLSPRESRFIGRKSGL